MAQSYLDPEAGLLVIPSAVAKPKVAQTDSTIATTGVVLVVGEATAGLDYANEEDLEENSFGPGQLGDVVAKYESGPLVDAFRGIISPANDPQILGTVSRVYLLKTNASARASAAILDDLSAAYGTLYARNYGESGNQINFTIVETDEVRPTTSSYTYISPVGTLTHTFRVNGAAAETVSVTAAMTPTAYVAAVNALTSVSASGGASRGTIGAVSGTLALAASGNQVVVTKSAAWSVTPTVGDTMIIPTGSCIAGGSNVNVGSYVITAVTSTTITAIKLSDHDKGGASAGTVTAPANVSAQSIASTTADLMAYSPVTVTTVGTAIINGIGKTLEINQTTAVEYTQYVLGTTTPVTWLSKSGSPAVIVSATERSVTMTTSRTSDDISDTWSVGGDIALKVGYTGTTATVQITSTQAIFTVVGGSGTSMTLTLKNFATISDLATYINNQTGYTAAVGNGVLGQKSPLSLDEGTFSCGTTYGNQTARIKCDAVRFYESVRDKSSLVVFSDDQTPAASGLPGAYSVTYLSGGTLGATTDADVSSALEAAEGLTVNFVVPAFSRDATDDIADDLTDAASTYTIDSINAATLAHVTAMSKIKAKKNRQAFLSKRTSLSDAKDASGTLASARATLCFQDAKALGGNGIEQFQPWMLAAKAAGMQAAAFYRAIFNKGIQITGVVTADGSYNPQKDDQTEDALLAGLLVARKSKSGGYRFVSDQTTYQKDNNFVFNSIQAVYAMDIIGLTLAQRAENAFVGQSLADVSAGAAVGVIQGILEDLRRLRLIAPSDEAPAGFRNIRIAVNGPVMQVQLEVFLATALYFVPISFTVSQVSQTATG